MAAEAANGSTGVAKERRGLDKVGAKVVKTPRNVAKILWGPAKTV
jgi:hypothetical protein